MNFIDIQLSKQYTKSTANSLGALKGAPCTIKSKQDVENGTKITFEWTGNNGATNTTDIIVKNGVKGEKGVSITGIEKINDTSFCFELSDGTRTEPLNLIKGDKGDKGEKGDKGDPFIYSDFTENQLNRLKGKDGFTPIISVTKEGKKTTITITDENGTTNSEIYDGSLEEVKISKEANNSLALKEDGLYVPKTTEVEISAEQGNALEKKEDGFYVSSSGVQISQEQDNAIESKLDGLFVPKTDETKVSTQDGNAIEIKEDGIYVPTQQVSISATQDNAITLKQDGLYVKNKQGAEISQTSGNTLTQEEDGLYVPTVDLSGYVEKEDGKSLISSEMLDKITSNENHIGDTSLLVVNSWADLVTAINSLYNSFMSKIEYANKVLTITYRNGYTFELNVSSIITDTKIGELFNVNDEGITDGQTLVYDNATQKYIPHTFDLGQVLQDAKDYADGKFNSINHANAIYVDEKPIYDNSGEKPIIKYKQSEVEKETDNMLNWFYYVNSTDEKTYQTIWIDGVEVTLAVANDVNFNDYVKTENVTDSYTGEEVDKTKIANVSALYSLQQLLVNSISLKVNTSDIVDNFLSDLTNVPASARTVKVLNEEVAKKTSINDVNASDNTTYSSNKILQELSGKIDSSIFEILNNEQTKQLFKMGV